MIKKCLTVVGARPQFIKAAPVSRSMAKAGIREILVHTGQHYDDNMSKVFFEELDLPRPDYNLGIGSGSHGVQTGRMLEGIEKIICREGPDLVLVYGDTNSTVAAALAAAKLHVPLAHVEAGLRSFNKRMPEEINRIVTDHVSSILFCPTETAVKNLKREGFLHVCNRGKLITAHRPPSMSTPSIFNVGDVMYDSVLFNLRRAKTRSRILERLGVRSGEYYLATLHRAENTDDPRALRGIFKAFDLLASKRPLILPLHPRMKARIARMKGLSRLTIIPPLPYHDMLVLSSAARVILTDSGGLQKEAYFLGTPCVTLRSETEWVETVRGGMNIVAGADLKRITSAVKSQEAGKKTLSKKTYFGDGHSADKIVRIIARL